MARKTHRYRREHGILETGGVGPRTVREVEAERLRKESAEAHRKKMRLRNLRREAVGIAIVGGAAVLLVELLRTAH